MTERDDTRDVIARTIHSVRCGCGNNIAWYDEANTVLAALERAGKSIVDDLGWEWSVFWKGNGDPLIFPDRSKAASHARHTKGSVFRRRPAGPWEVAPDA